MIDPSCPKLTPADKLDLLRRLNRYRHWDSHDDVRRCLECGTIITGRKILIDGGKTAFDSLRAKCPTEGCSSIPIDWALPSSFRESGPDGVAGTDGEVEPLPPPDDLAAAEDVPDADALAHRILLKAYRAFRRSRSSAPAIFA